MKKNNKDSNFLAYITTKLMRKKSRNSCFSAVVWGQHSRIDDLHMSPKYYFKFISLVG